MNTHTAQPQAESMDDNQQLSWNMKTVARDLLEHGDNPLDPACCVACACYPCLCAAAQYETMNEEPTTAREIQMLRDSKQHLQQAHERMSARGLLFGLEDSNAPLSADARDQIALESYRVHARMTNAKIRSIDWKNYYFNCCCWPCAACLTCIIGKALNR